MHRARVIRGARRVPGACRTLHPELAGGRIGSSRTALIMLCSYRGGLADARFKGNSGGVVGAVGALHRRLLASN